MFYKTINFCENELTLDGATFSKALSFSLKKYTNLFTTATKQDYRKKMINYLKAMKWAITYIQCNLSRIINTIFRESKAEIQDKRAFGTFFIAIYENIFFNLFD